MRTINFVCELGGSYGNIVLSIIDPIRVFLSQSQISVEPIPDGVNIFFFVEDSYKERASQGIGINVYHDHGISDKLYRSELHRLEFYDYVCVSGPLWEKKMLQLGLPGEKIVTVGYARLDPLFQRQNEQKPRSNKRVLWAPTHSKSISSYPEMEPLLSGISKNQEVVQVLHPYDSPNITPAMDELIETDVVISDTSSIIYEAWSLGKPVIFPDWLVKDRVCTNFTGSLEDWIYREKIGYHAENKTQLFQLIEYALKHGIDKKAQQFIEAVLPAKYHGCSGELTAKMIVEIANNKPMRSGI